MPTRAWELLAGALVAETLDTHLARIPDPTRAALASVGLTGLCIVCVACDDQMAALPGAITVLPVRFIGRIPIHECALVRSITRVHI